MDAETLQALKGSIEKWEKIVAGTGFDEGTSNCPLCAKFDDDLCSGCPVAERVEESCCRGTPYVAFDRLRTKLGDEADEHTYGLPIAATGENGLKQLAQAELDFLKFLLPSDQQPAPR